MTTALLSPAVLLLLGSANGHPAAPQSDWPQFGGPSRTSMVPALDTKFEWDDGGPKVRWRAPTGPGFGGVAVQGGEVFLHDCVLGEKDVLRVYDLATGAETWNAEYEAPGRLPFPGSRTVPAVTAEEVFTSGGQGQVTCFDRKTRAIRWMESVRETYGGEDPGFGWSAAPLVVGDVVVFAVLGDEVGLVAFDRKSGEERWVTEGIGSSHSTPMLLTLLGEPQIVMLSTIAQATGQDEAAPMAITGIDPGDGSILWRHDTTLSRLPIPGAVQIDDQRFFVTGGYRGGSTLFRIQKKAGKHAVEELFHIERGAQVHLPMLHEGHLYLIVNENWNEARNRHAEGGLMCLTLDGKELWRTGESPNFGRGSLVLAGDHLLIQDGFDGTLRVARASPKGYEPVAEAQVFAGNGDRDGQMWAPMALAGRCLLLRSQEELVCLEL